MSKLNLVPNEIVGYRIHPDQWNWKVVEVKKHGENSKNAGQEFETVLSYPKDIRYAVKYIVNYVAAIEGDKLQRLSFERDGVAANLASLEEAFVKAENAALKAVEDLEKRLQAVGVDLNTLNKRIFQESESEIVE